MITKHTIIDYDVDGSEFGAVVLAQGPKGKSQKIFHVLEDINIDESEWYMDKYVTLKGTSHNPKGLTSVKLENIGNFKDQKEHPEKVFDIFPEYFL